MFAYKPMEFGWQLIFAINNKKVKIFWPVDKYQWTKPAYITLQWSWHNSRNELQLEKCWNDLIKNNERFYEQLISIVIPSSQTFFFNYNHLKIYWSIHISYAPFVILSLHCFYHKTLTRYVSSHIQSQKISEDNRKWNWWLKEKIHNTQIYIVI